MVQITSHTDKIKELGNKMVDNLKAQGVSASFEDGGMTLAEKILDIKPFTTTITLTSPITEITEGQTIDDSLKIQATLKAQYNDSLISVDVPIKNVGVFIIKNGNEIGYIVNSNGQCERKIASDTSGLSVGDHLVYKAVFQGESFYPSCESSSVTITVRKYHIDITPIKITREECIFKVINTDTNEGISSATCTITAVTTNGQTLQQKNFTTNSTGQITTNISQFEAPTGTYIASWTITVDESNVYEGTQQTFNG